MNKAMKVTYAVIAMVITIASSYLVWIIYL